VMYRPEGCSYRDAKFIARFKYKSAAACANHYVKEMIRLLSKEELEEAIIACLPGRAPASEAMDARGYVNYNVGKIAKSMGLAPNQLNDNPGLAFKKAV
jgi:hypothetical protein